MRDDGLAARQPTRGGVRTTDSTHAYPIAPNLLDRQFDVHGVRLNRIWVSDITYVPTGEGWLYLAVVLDLASRRVVSWSMRETLAAEGALAALQMAIQARRPTAGLIHHSDRGVQPRFNRSSQQRVYDLIVTARSMLRQACASRASFAAGC